MRQVIRALAVVSAALVVSCQDGGPNAGLEAPTTPTSGESGTATVHGSVLGRGVSTVPGDTLVGIPLAGVRVRLYRQSVPVTTCDSTGASPVCTTHPAEEGDEVTLPDGTVLTGSLAATVTTDNDGNFSASDLESWMYFLIADPPAGAAFRSGAMIYLWVSDGDTTFWPLWLAPL